MSAVVALLGTLLLAGGGPRDAAQGEKGIFESGPLRDAAVAARKGNRARLRALVKGGLDIEQQSSEFKTPYGPDTMTLLVWAVWNGSKGGTEELIKLGADPNKGTSLGYVPLMAALARTDDRMLNLLLDVHHVDPNKVFADSDTPLTLALSSRDRIGDRAFSRAESLLEHGADVDQKAWKTLTAAGYFGMVENWRLVDWLLRHGASPEIGGTSSVVAKLCQSFASDLPLVRGDEARQYRDKVRDYLVTHGIDRARVDPKLQPDGKCKHE